MFKERQNLGISCRRVENRDRWFAVAPAAGLAGVEEQSPEFVFVNARLMSVCVNQNVELSLTALRPGQSVREQNSGSVGGSVTEGRLADRADNFHPAVETDFVSLVVAETANKRAIEFSQRRDRKRRHQIAGKQNRFDLLLIKPLDSHSKIIEVIVNVGENSNSHGRSAFRLSRSEHGRRLKVRSEIRDRNFEAIYRQAKCYASTSLMT